MSIIATYPFAKV
jgi:hypothetical protein